jgi:hypothetical protein
MRHQRGACACAAVLVAAFAVPAAAAPATAVSFDHRGARKKMIAFDRAYRADYARGVGRYYGRLWASSYARRQRSADGAQTIWQRYMGELRKRGVKPRRIDCTLYAQAVLEAGMPARSYRELWRGHRAIWKARGFAGWSVAHLLTTHHGWRAYAFIRRGAPHYHYYMHHFIKRQEYPVWKQPNIKIERHFTLGRDDRAVEALLKQHRFGWGFSDGGIHTWITSGRDLKECHYDSGPSKRYEIPQGHSLYRVGLQGAREPLFKTTRFVAFRDYRVHLVVFPPALP